MFHLTKGKIEPRESFFIYAKLRAVQSATTLNGVDASVNHDTIFFMCLNRMQNTNKNLFYLSCDPEDYLVNRSSYCKSSGAVEFTYSELSPSTYRLKYKNNIHHTTGYVQNSTFSNLSETYSHPPGAELRIIPSPEYNIPHDIHQGPAYDLTMGGQKLNYYFRKNTSQAGTKNTFETLANLPNASPKFISLNRSYIKFTSSDYLATDEGIKIIDATDAAQINFLGEGILMDGNSNFFDYMIVDKTHEVNIIGTSKYNSATVGAEMEKSQDVYFILSSDFTNSFTNLQTLIGGNFSPNTQYLDFYMLKKKSYGSGGNKYISHGYNTSTSTNKFYSHGSGVLSNPLAYGVLIHFIETYIDASNLPVNNYATLKTNSRNPNPTQPHVMFSKLHDSFLELNYGYDVNGANNNNNISQSAPNQQITYSSVGTGGIFQNDSSQHSYNPSYDYAWLGTLLGCSFIILIITIYYIVKLFNKEEKMNQDDINNMNLNNTNQNDINNMNINNTNLNDGY